MTRADFKAIMAEEGAKILRAEKAKMVSRAISKGHSRAEATTRLDELHTSHSGFNLVSALVYWGYATEHKAHEYITTQGL